MNDVLNYAPPSVRSPQSLHWMIVRAFCMFACIWWSYRTVETVEYLNTSYPREMVGTCGTGRNGVRQDAGMVTCWTILSAIAAIVASLVPGIVAIITRILAAGTCSCWIWLTLMVTERVYFTPWPV